MTDEVGREGMPETRYLANDPEAQCCIGPRGRAGLTPCADQREQDG
jgi:hypothetical protein